MTGFTFGGNTSTTFSNKVNAGTTSTTSAATAGGAAGDSTTPAVGGGLFSFASASTSNSTSASTSTSTSTFQTSNATNNHNNNHTSIDTGTGAGNSYASTSAANATSHAQNASNTVPTYEEAFPFLAMNYKIESILNSIHECAYKDNDNNNNFNCGNNTEMELLGQELYHLLSSLGPYKCLSNPNQVLKKPAAPNSALRQQLQSNPRLIFPSSTSDTQTVVTSNMLQKIFDISDLLHISEMEAASIYSVIQTSTVSTSTATNSMDQHVMGQNTIHWFQKNSYHTSNGFIEKVIQKAKDDGTYVTSTSTKATTTTTNADNDQEHKRIIHHAINLFFTERISYLQTLLLLVQHRVLVYSNLLEQPSQQESSQQALYTKVILESTDLLVNQNLITNLISFIEQLTIQNEQVQNKICIALDYFKNNQQQHNNEQQQQIQQQSSAFGFSTGFGTNNTGIGTNPNQNNLAATATPPIHNIDYAMYEYTLQLRQMASECLFYLTYHTQCIPNEVTSLLDLVQHLTNGASINNYSNTAGNNAGSGIGPGLTVLDPIRDVPDPYVLSWINNSHDTTTSSTTTTSTSTLMPMQGITMTAPPQQYKVEKGRDEWEHELSSSLMSVRGLLNATITSIHHDFTGHSTYHATPLRSIAANTETGSNGNVNVNGGKPQLLQCVTTLIMSIICSLDGQNTLLDRINHGPNDFGIGNALFPPTLSLQNPTEIHDALTGIHERLNPSSAKYTRWKRQDIGGLLSTSYALLLRPAINIFTSPTKPSRERSSSGSSTSSLTSNVVYQTFQSCLEISSLTKSLTFARVSLIPCIGLPSMRSSSTILDNNFTFYISVLSDFTSQYLDAISSRRDLPISRAKWMELEMNELQMKHIQETQRRQLNALSGQKYQEVSIPNEVDMSQRPDCLDDIIALAVKICFVYPDSASRFCTTRETIVMHEKEQEDGEEGKADEVIHELQLGKIVNKLDKARVKDSSLLPVYISLLGAISLYQYSHDELSPLNGAEAVHQLLMTTPNSNIDTVHTPPSNYTDENKITWVYVLNKIRWYNNQLNPQQDDHNVHHDSWRTSGSMMHDQTDSEEATGYYYGADKSSNYNNTSSNVRQQSSTSSSSSSFRKSQNGPKELDESSSQELLSLLSLLSHVAYKSEVARKFILDIKLPVPGSKRFVAVEDDVLTILFSLVLTPISSELRGMAFSAVANMLRCGSFDALSVEEQSKNEELISRCWGLLEWAQVLPTRRLAQYSLVSETPTLNPFYSSSFNRGEINWFPPLEQNGIIYEMEYLESKQGSYPATEGLLKLLAVMFASHCCPPDLGAGTRKMLGCSPYVEYVIDFVLPRVMEVKNGKETLYFHSSAEKSRLLTRALEVINSVLVWYEVPSQLSTRTSVGPNEPSLVAEGPFMREAGSKNGLSTAVNEPTKPSTPDASLSLVHDFIYPPLRNYKTRDTETDFSNAIPQHSSSTVSQLESIPQAKSPGFYVLANLLSSDGVLLNILCQILMQHQKVESIGDLDGNLQNVEFNINALFGEIAPHYSTVKGARDYLLDHHKNDLTSVHISTILPRFFNNFIEPLFSANIQETPKLKVCDNNKSTVLNVDEISWKEHCVLMILKIISAAFARSALFKKCIHESESKLASSTCIVPVLKFCPRDNRVVVPLSVKHIQVRDMSKAIVDNHVMLPFLFQCTGYKPTSLSNNNHMAALAVSIIQYIINNVQHSDISRCLKGMNKVQQSNITIAFAERLSLAREDKDNLDISGVILKQLASSFDGDSHSGGKELLSRIILGLSCRSNADMKDYLLQCYHRIDPPFCDNSNALDVLIELVSDINFILEPELSSLASKCYEIIYRICDNENANNQLSKLCIIVKLRRIGFWETQLLRFFVPNQASESLLRTIISNLLSHDADILLDEMSLIRRDADFLHSMSWILKGVGNEFCSLIGYKYVDKASYDFDSTITALLSPQPAKCRELLSILCGDASGVIISTLQSLPVNQLPLTKMLGANAPSRDILKSASIKMEGPDDIYHGYQIIDVQKLKGAMNLYCTSDDNQKEVLHWALKWNSFVNLSCASSHLSESWCFLTQITTSCAGLIESDVRYDEYLVNTLRQILVCLNENDYSRIISNVSTSGNGELEPNIIHPLALLSISIIDQVIAGESLNQDEAQQILLLLVGGIASCNVESNSQDISNMKRAAYLACALTTFVGFLSEHENYLFLGSLLQSLYIEVYRAAPYLIRLSIMSMVETEIEKHFIIQAARAGLASLINMFNSVEKSNDFIGSSNLIVELFESHKGIALHSERNSFLSQCTVLLEKFDDTIINLLQVIAICNNGTDIMVKNGISKTLNRISREFLDNNKFSKSTYGSIGVQVPAFLSFHFSLFNSMLSSENSTSVRIQLVGDVMAFLQMHSANAERILCGYPKNHGLIVNIVTTFLLLSSACRETNEFMNPQLRKCEWFLNLERHVIDLALHLAAYPLPPQYLVRLPKELRSIIDSNSDQTAESSWWDAVELEAGDNMHSPNPTTIRGIGQGENTSFSSTMYNVACLASQYVDLSLHYLLSTFKESNFVAAEAVSLATAICRYSDILQATTQRLSKLKADEGSILTEMFSSMMERDNDLCTRNQQSKIEIEALETYNFVLVSCFEKLLYLAKEKVQQEIMNVKDIMAMKAAVNHMHLLFGNDPNPSFSSSMLKQLMKNLQ